MVNNDHPSFWITKNVIRFILPFSILKKGKSWLSPKEFENVFHSVLNRIQQSNLWEFQPHQQRQFILPYVEEFLTTSLKTPKLKGSTFVFSVSNDPLQRHFGQRKTKVLVQRNINGPESKKEWLLFSIKSFTPLLYLFKTGTGMLIFQIEIEDGDPVQIYAFDGTQHIRSEKLNLELITWFNQNLRILLPQQNTAKYLKSAVLLPATSILFKKFPTMDREYQIKPELAESIHRHIHSRHHHNSPSTTSTQSLHTLKPVPTSALVEYFLTPIGKLNQDWDAFYEYRMMGYSYIQIRKEDKIQNPAEVAYDEIAAPLFWLRQYITPEYLPSETDLILENNPYLYQSFRNIYFGFSLEGGVTIVWESESEFIRKEFYTRVLNEYFTLFLLALHQQMLSHRINKQVNEITTYANRIKIKMIKYLRDQIFEFLLKNWFPQVSNNLVYNEVYNRWQKVFQVEPLFNEIKREIDELDEYLERKKQQQENRLLSFITWFFFPFVFIVGVWGMNIREVVVNPLSIFNVQFWILSSIIFIIYYSVLGVFWFLKGKK